MAEIPAIVKKKIKKFINLLENNKISIQRAYIFGSYANGHADKWSDIDIALISDDFTGNRFQDRLNLIDYVFEASTDISPLPFLPEDFEDSMFARDEILKKGILINLKSI